MSPLFREPQNLHNYDRLYLATGRLILNWALTEDAINTAILRIWTDAGRKKSELSIPNRFRNRLTCLGRLIRELSKDDAIKRDANKIIGTLARLKKVRDAMAHSRVMPDFDNEPFIFLGINSKRDEQMDGRNPYGGVFGPRISLDKLESELNNLETYPAKITGLWGRVGAELRTTKK